MTPMPDSNDPIFCLTVLTRLPPPHLPLYLTESAEEARLFRQNALFAASQNARNSIGFCEESGVNGGERDGRKRASDEARGVGGANEQYIGAEVAGDDSAENDVGQLSGGRLWRGG